MIFKSNVVNPLNHQQGIRSKGSSRGDLHSNDDCGTFNGLGLVRKIKPFNVSTFQLIIAIRCGRLF